MAQMERFQVGGEARGVDRIHLFAIRITSTRLLPFLAVFTTTSLTIDRRLGAFRTSGTPLAIGRLEIWFLFAFAYLHIVVRVPAGHGKKGFLALTASSHISYHV